MTSRRELLGLLAIISLRSAQHETLFSIGDRVTLYGRLGVIKGVNTANRFASGQVLYSVACMPRGWVYVGTAADLGHVIYQGREPAGIRKPV